MGAIKKISCAKFRTARSTTKAIEYYFKQDKRVVEINILYKILTLYIHKRLLGSKLKSLLCRRIWLATPKRDP